MNPENMKIQTLTFTAFAARRWTVTDPTPFISRP